MKDYIEERAISIANYIIESNATVRQTAKAFGVSKSTVHKDVTERLVQVNPALAAEARKVLDVNKSERHIRKTEGKIKQAMAAQGEVLQHCHGLFLCRLLSKFVEKGTIP